MPQLLGRKQELADITAFATSTGPGAAGYRWLVGGAYAGKSALIHEAVTAELRETVDVIVYYLRRVASDADSNGFLTAVIPQLAALVGAEVVDRDEHTYRTLWAQAVPGRSRAMLSGSRS